MHHVPLHASASLPTVMMAIGFVIAWQFYIRRPDIPVELARQHELLYRFLLNKWYFDELYDFLFVRPAKWLGRALWKGGDGWLIDGFGPDGVSARVLDVTRNVVRLQTGYLYHYAFAMLIGVAAFITWFMFAGRAADDELADPLRRHLPAAGRRAVHHAGARRRRARQAQRALGRAVDHARHLRDLAGDGVALRSGVGRIPVRREARLARRRHPTTWASTAFRCRS